MDRVQRQQKALLEAIELHDKSDMVSELVTHMVNAVPKISAQRRYIDFLVSDIKRLAPEVSEWRPSLDVAIAIRDERYRENARVPISGPPGRSFSRFLRTVDNTWPKPRIPRSLLGLSVSNNERGE